MFLVIYIGKFVVNWYFSYNCYYIGCCYLSKFIEVFKICYDVVYCGGNNCIVYCRY